MKFMNVLALDVGSRLTGYAVFNGETLSSSGLIASNSTLGHPEKLVNVSACVRNLIKDFNIDEIVIEDVYGGKNIRTLKILSYYHGALQLVACEEGASTYFMGASRWRSILSRIYGVKLLLRDRIDCKLATESFIKLKFPSASDCGEDECDAIALGIAYIEYQRMLCEAITEVRTDNRKLRSPDKIRGLAEKRLLETLKTIN